MSKTIATTVVLCLIFSVGGHAADGLKPKASKTASRPVGERTVIGDVPWDPDTLATGEKAIYGTDDRLDLYQVTDPDRVQWAASVCGLFDSVDVTDNDNGTHTIGTYTFTYFGDPICPSEPYTTQPVSAWCTGFVVGEDLIATAGHCYTESDLASTSFVFGFVMTDASTAVTTVSDSQVYTGVEVVAQESTWDEDYAIIRVDRPITAPGATALPLRRTGSVPVGTSIGIIGHPVGLPLKIAFGANTKVLASIDTYYFESNLDVYGGNSGSPVFNAATGDVEGILVYGGDDFAWLGSCYVSTQYADASGIEGVTRSTVFESFVPIPVSSEGKIGLDRTSYTCADTITITVGDTDLTGTAEVEVTASGGDSETVTLTETGVGTGRFTGSLALEAGSGASEDGLLNALEGETVTATYQDADTGAGSPGTVTAEAEVDCTPPTVSNVAVSYVAGNQANLTFDTDEAAEARVRFGVNCADLSNSSQSTGFGLAHDVSITGLTPQTYYAYVIEVTDIAGNSATFDNSGGCYEFATLDQNDYFTELFGTPLNLDYTKLTFTLDGSPDHYRLCTQSVTAFPSTIYGTQLALDDEDYVEVFLSGGKEVSFYGQSYGSFFVGSNGYVTFGTGDDYSWESYFDHFYMPRISALYRDLDPSAGGGIFWMQFNDRVVVTYRDVPEWLIDNANTFQVELFFDGTITITHLDVDATQGLVGLSEGLGIPADFEESLLYTYPTCGSYTWVSPFDGPGVPVAGTAALGMLGAVTIAGAAWRLRRRRYC